MCVCVYLFVCLVFLFICAFVVAVVFLSFPLLELQQRTQVANCLWRSAQSAPIQSIKPLLTRQGDPCTWKFGLVRAGAKK